MRRLLLLSLLSLLPGCPPASGYHVNLTVTVPPEVQSAFSSASPGLLMTRVTLLGQLCDPTDTPFTVPFSFWMAGPPCQKQLALGYQNMYVVRLSASDLDWFAANQPDLRCGQTRAITDLSIVDSVTQRAIADMWGSNGPQTIATGSGGACNAAGDYTGTILLQLTQ